MSVALHISFTPAAARRSVINKKGLNMNVLVLPPLKPKNLTRNQCQQTGQTRMQRHHHLQVKTLVFPLLWGRDTIAVAQGRVCLSTHTDPRVQRRLTAWPCHKYGTIKSSISPQLGQIRLRRRAVVCSTASRVANRNRGPIWVYHVVSLAVGAMQPRPPASCQPHLKGRGWSLATIYFWME